MKEFKLEIILGIQLLHGELLNHVFELITYIGETTIIIAVITFIYLVYDKRIGKKVVYISILSMVINGMLKLVIRAPRPIGEPGIVSLRVETAGGYSFPSGHSQNTATLFTWLALIIKKRWFTILSLILVFLVMISRLYLGVHYPIDVVVGASLGWGVSYYLFRKLDQLKHPTLTMLIVVVAFLPLTVLFGIFDPSMAGELFKMVGLLAGSFLGFLFEEKYVQFSMNTQKWKALLRFLIGIGIALGLQTGLKWIFMEGLYGDMLRYFFVAFISLGLYPYLFKKLRF